jgi:hypothetical protein
MCHTAQTMATRQSRFAWRGKSRACFTRYDAPNFSVKVVAAQTEALHEGVVGVFLI